MKRIITITFLTISVFATQIAFGQVDTLAIKSFLTKQALDEEKFIDLLKRNKVDSCMTFFSSSVISKYGTDNLQNELKKLNGLFNKYSNVKNTVSLGKSFNGVGTFGHDNDGNYEKSSVYQFYKRKDVAYYFTLYYSDNEPMGIIKYYVSKDLSDFKPVRKLKP